MNPAENGRRGGEARMGARIEFSSIDGEVTLRQYIPEDAEAAFNLIDRNREHLSQFGEPTGRKYATVDEFRQSITYPEDSSRLRFGIWSSEGELVGSANITPERKGSSIGVLGYYLGAEFTGRGYATRAALTLVEYAFEKLDYSVVKALVHPGNIPSQRVLERVGFERGEPEKDGTLVFIQLRVNKSDSIYPYQQ